jgi:hypothetical protein
MLEQFHDQVDRFPGFAATGPEMNADADLIMELLQERKKKEEAKK